MILKHSKINEDEPLKDKKSKVKININYWIKFCLNTKLFEYNASKSVDPFEGTQNAWYHNTWTQ